MRPISLALSILTNRAGGVPRPSWCTYLVTFRCNARCGMCDSWRIRPGAELTPAEVATVFRRIGRLDVVRLSGGEPFLRGDFAEIAERVLETSNPSVLHVTTNGSFPQRVEALVRACSQPRRLRFMVSFDGMPAEHAANRGRDVTFERAADTVRRLAALRDRFGVEVSVNHTVISRQSMDDHEAIRETFRGLDIDVHAVLAYRESAMYGAKRRGARANDLIVLSGYPLHESLDHAESLAFAARQLQRVDEFRSPLLRRGKHYYWSGLHARLRGDEAPRPRPKCVALRSHLRLLPDGGVPVCQFNTEVVGNLLRQPFDEVWRGAAAAGSRAWVDACPGCWAECEVMPNAIFSGDIFFGARAGRGGPSSVRQLQPTPTQQSQPARCT